MSKSFKKKGRLHNQKEVKEPKTGSMTEKGMGEIRKTKKHRKENK